MQRSARASWFFADFCAESRCACIQDLAGAAPGSSLRQAPLSARHAAIYACAPQLGQKKKKKIKRKGQKKQNGARIEATANALSITACFRLASCSLVLHNNKFGHYICSNAFLSFFFVFFFFFAPEVCAACAEQRRRNFSNSVCIPMQLVEMCLRVEGHHKTRKKTNLLWHFCASGGVRQLATCRSTRGAPNLVCIQMKSIYVGHNASCHRAPALLSAISTCSFGRKKAKKQHFLRRTWTQNKPENG